MKFNDLLATLCFKKNLISLAVVFFLLGSANRVYSATSRSELQAKMYAQIVRILATSRIDDHAQQELGKRAEQISSIVQYYPQDIVPDDIATWIEQSVLPIVKKRKPYLISDDKTAERYIKHIDDAAKANFSQLSPSIIPELRRRSEKLLTAAKLYREKRNLYLIDHLSQSKLIRINFSNGIFTGNDSFSDILLAIRPELLLAWLKPDEKHIDLSDSQIDSMLLTCGFVRKIEDYIKADEEGDEVGYTSLLSSVLFIDDFKTRDFSTVLPIIEKLWDKAVTQEGNVTIMDYDGFSYFLMKSSTLHWEDDTEFNQSEDISDEKTEVPPYVIFKNENYPWQILQNAVLKSQDN